LRLIGLVVTIALVDSLNPSTIAPASYLASGECARRSVLEFTGAVFVTHLVGGVLLLIGPGRLLLSLLSGLGSTVQHVGELALGLALVVVGALTWHQRSRLSRQDMPDPNPKRRSSVILGASIIAVELPTAFPYFAAIAARSLDQGSPSPASSRRSFSTTLLRGSTDRDPCDADHGRGRCKDEAPASP
jgi:hypothetical protein